MITFEPYLYSSKHEIRLWVLINFTINDTHSCSITSDIKKCLYTFENGMCVRIQKQYGVNRFCSVNFRELDVRSIPDYTGARSGSPQQTISYAHITSNTQI